MNKKLTLSIDKDVVNDAKKYLQKDKQSLSKLIEDYFKALTKVELSKSPTESSLVSELIGIATGSNKSADQLKEEYLSEKYK